MEVREDHLLKARFRAIDKFKRSDESREPFNNGILLDEPAFTVRTATLEHRVPCLGFAVKEMFHVNVRKDRLTALEFSSGPWLNELKRFIFEGKPDDFMVPVLVNGGKETKEMALGPLKEDLLFISPGQKIAYVTDTVYNEENKNRIVGLIAEADVFFCESPFLAEEEERGAERRTSVVLLRSTMRQS